MLKNTRNVKENRKNVFMTGCIKHTIWWTQNHAAHVWKRRKLNNTSQYFNLLGHRCHHPWACRHWRTLPSSVELLQEHSKETGKWKEKCTSVGQKVRDQEKNYLLSEGKTWKTKHCDFEIWLPRLDTERHWKKKLKNGRSKTCRNDSEEFDW